MTKTLTVLGIFAIALALMCAPFVNSYVNPEPEPEGDLYVRIIAIHDGVTNGPWRIDIDEMIEGANTYDGRMMQIDHDYSVHSSVGEIVKAYPGYDEDTDTFYIEVIAVIKDERAIEQVKLGLYKFVSVGFMYDYALCSIDGNHINMNPWGVSSCGAHFAGQKYLVDEEMVTAYAILQDIEFLELSFVAIPADRDAEVIEYSHNFNEILENGLEEMAEYLQHYDGQK